MSNRLFQSVIHQMKDAVDRTIGVIDESGSIIACSELGRIGEALGPSVSEAVFSTVGSVGSGDLLLIRASRVCRVC